MLPSLQAVGQAKDAAVIDIVETVEKYFLVSLFG